MAFLITGAAGLLGTHLIEALAGEKVISLVRDHDPHTLSNELGHHNRVIEVRGDLSEPGLIERVIVQYGVHYVFHLGAQTLVGSGIQLPIETFESNIRGTYLLLEACRRHLAQIKHITIASSDKAYGEAEQLPYTETTPLRGGSPYDASKACCDLLAQSYLTTYEMPIAIARCGNLFGPGDRHMSRLIPGTIHALMNDQRPVIRSDGTFKRDYLYVKDAVDGYLALADRCAVGPYNFGPEKPRTVMEVVEAIGCAMGRLTDPIILNEAKGEIRDQYLDASKAQRELNWVSSTPFELALQETVEWYERSICRAH